MKEHMSLEEKECEETLMRINFLMVQNVLERILSSSYKIGEEIDLQPQDKMHIIKQLLENMSQDLIKKVLRDLFLDFLETTLEGLNKDIYKIWKIRKENSEITAEELTAILLLSESESCADEIRILSNLETEERDTVKEVSEGISGKIEKPKVRNRMHDPYFV